MARRPRAVNREAWLHQALEAMRPWFQERGHPLPKKLAVSCGFPINKGVDRGTVGQCWDPRCTRDNTVHMFICPTLEDPLEILGTLLHELVHAAVGLEHGHRGLFKTVARGFGLVGPMTATTVEEGSPLHKQLSALARELGVYPHAAMRLGDRPEGGEPEERPEPKWVRLVSPGDDKYTLVISRLSLERVGYPSDPWGNQMRPR